MSIITATNLTRSFTLGSVTEHVLRGVSLTVATGEFLGIMGKSGAGKSTLLYQLSALDTPNSGDLVIDGVCISKLSEHARTQFRLHTLGFVFQDYALVPDLSAEENVVIPLLMKGIAWSEATDKARAAIDAVDMAGKYRNLPNELSGGEQQRIAIARAVAGEPKILFADEPTANLDTVSGQMVIDLLTTIHQTQKQTIVMVTHEREYADSCDRIVHMEDGAIVHQEQLR